MKKVSLTLLALVAFVMISKAQYTAGGITTEVNFRPFNANPIAVDYLKVRYFLSDKMAVRCGLSLNTMNEKSEVAGDLTDNPGVTTNDATELTKNSCFIFGLFPGIEMHLGTNEKISPYVGAEIGFQMKSAKGSIANLNNDATQSVACKGVWTDGSNQAYTQFGFNLLTGVDVAIYKGLYMGAEFGFGYSSTSLKDVETSVTVAGVTTTAPLVLGDNFGNFGVNFNSAIRLGWSF